MSARPQDEEEDLADLKCLVLESTREILVKDIDPTKFLPYLRSKFVIDAKENAIIKSCCSRSVHEGAEKFIDVLCTKGSKGYDQFCVALVRDETQLHILKRLNKRLERERHLKKERDRLHQQQVEDLQRRRRHDPTRVQPYVPASPQPLDLGGGGPQSAHTTSCIGYVSQDYLRSRESPNQMCVVGSLDYHHQAPTTSPLQTFPGSPQHSSAFSPLHSPFMRGELAYQPASATLQPPASLGFDNQFNFMPRAPDSSWAVSEHSVYPSSALQADDGPQGQPQPLPYSPQQ